MLFLLNKSTGIRKSSFFLKSCLQEGFPLHAVQGVEAWVGGKVGNLPYKIELVFVGEFFGVKLGDPSRLRAS